MDLEQISTSLEDIRQEVQTMRLAQPNVLGLHVAFVGPRACSSLSLSRSLSLSLALSLALSGTKLGSPSLRARRAEAARARLVMPLEAGNACTR